MDPFQKSKGIVRALIEHKGKTNSSPNNCDSDVAVFDSAQAMLRYLVIVDATFTISLLSKGCSSVASGGGIPPNAASETVEATGAVAGITTVVTEAVESAGCQEAEVTQGTQSLEGAAAEVTQITTQTQWAASAEF